MAAAKTVQVIVVGNVRSAQAELSKLESQAATFAGRMQALGTSVVSVGQRISALGSTLTRRLTLPLIAAGGAAAKLSMDFESSMQKIVGLVGVSQQQVTAWKDDVLDLARTLPQGPTELADALFFVTSAGLRGSEAMDALKASARAAAAGLGDTATVADAVTSALNSYAQSGLTARQATNVMIAAVREGKMEASELAGVLGGVLPVASQVGVGFEEVAAAIASATRQGLEASRAATGVRFLLASFIKPSAQAKDALDRVGLSVAGLQRSLSERGLLVTMQMLAERFDLSTAKGRQLFATVVGGARGMSVASILVGQNAEDVEGVFDSLAHSAGSLRTAFDTASETAGFKLRAAFTSLQVAAVKFGDIIAPVVAKVAQAFAGLVDRLAALPPGTQQMIVQIAAVAAAAGPALKIVGLLTQGVGHLIQVFAFLAANPIVAVIAGLALLTAAFLRTEQGQRVLHQIMTEVWPQIQALVSDVIAAVSDLITAFVAFATDIWRRWGEDIMAVLRPALEVIVTIVETALALITNQIRFFAALLRGDWSAAWDAVKNVVRIAWQAIQELVRAGLDAVVAILRLAVSVLVELGRSLMRGLWDGLRAVASAVLDWFRALPGRILDALGSLASLLFDLGRRAILSLWDGLKSAAGGVVRWAGDLASDIAHALNPANWFSTPEEHYRRLWRAAFAAIPDEARRALPAVAEGVRAIGGAAVPDVGPMARRGGGDTVVNVIVHGWVGDEARLAETVRRSLLRIGARNQDIFGGKA